MAPPLFRRRLSLMSSEVAGQLGARAICAGRELVQGVLARVRCSRHSTVFRNLR